MGGTRTTVKSHRPSLVGSQRSVAARTGRRQTSARLGTRQRATFDHDQQLERNTSNLLDRGRHHDLCGHLYDGDCVESFSGRFLASNGSSRGRSRSVSRWTTLTERGGAVAARMAHNHEVAGAIPVPATRSRLRPSGGPGGSARGIGRSTRTSKARRFPTVPLHPMTSQPGRARR